jgi:hypothetical protein
MSVTPGFGQGKEARAVARADYTLSMKNSHHHGTDAPTLFKAQLTYPPDLFRPYGT